MKTLLMTAALALGLAQAAQAQDYPKAPVTIVVPYSPSGNTDVFMRHLAPYLEKKWGQPVVIDNRPGGGSMVGTAYVSQAKPDGYTLLLTSSAFVTAPALQASLPFDPRTDLMPIVNPGFVSFLLVVNGESGYDTLEDFIADSKESPKFGATAGLGTTTHFAMEQFIAESGADVDVVHFKGGGPAVVSILSREADIYGSSVSSAGEHIKTGAIKPLAIIGDERIPLLPDVPSTKELGYEGLNIKQWIGLFAPAGTDPAILSKVNADVNEAIQNADFIQTVTPLDWTLNQSTVEGFSEKVNTELDVWKQLAIDRGLAQ
jgi:tripartite-type tricarboxylate transporter receptor subunit TctC